MKLTLSLAKETKTKLVYIDENGPIPTLYIDKTARPVADRPVTITVQIDEACTDD